MFRKLLTIGTTGALAVAALVAPTAANAQPWGYGGGYERGYDGYRGDRYRGDRYRGGDRYYGGRGYRDGGRYYGNRGYYGRGYADRGGRGYYGRGGRCRDKGTGGTIIGAIAGGLLGNEVGQGRYGRGDGTAGAIVGGGLGALAGRAIDRNC